MTPFVVEATLLLVRLSTKETLERDEDSLRRLQEQLVGQDRSAVLRASRRAYPAIMLADEDLWTDLERESLGNMALSPEESEVLSSVRDPGDSDPFPLFINGRAGSGKSTILQYLFADLLFYYLTQPAAQELAPPIYLTANGELLRIARNLVERLLKSEATFRQWSDADLVEGNREVLDRAFCQFLAYLFSLYFLARASLVTSARNPGRLCPLSPHVDGPLWAGKTGTTRLWPRHLLARDPYIHQGDEFPDLSRSGRLHPGGEKQITVTREAYSLVYDRVWTNWYEPELKQRHSGTTRT